MDPDKLRLPNMIIVEKEEDFKRKHTFCKVDFRQRKVNIRVWTIAFSQLGLVKYQGIPMTIIEHIFQIFWEENIGKSFEAHKNVRHSLTSQLRNINLLARQPNNRNIFTSKYDTKGAWANMKR